MSDAILLEALRRPETWAILIALLGLIGSFKVISVLLGILKHRETSNERQLSQLEGIAECQAKLLSIDGLIYTHLLELKEKLAVLENTNREGLKK